MTNKTNMKLNNIPVIPKMVKKLITDFHFFKRSDCIPLMIFSICVRRTLVSQIVAKSHLWVL